MAIRLEKALGSTADTWLRMEMNYDLARASENKIKVARYKRPHMRQPKFRDGWRKLRFSSGHLFLKLERRCANAASLGGLDKHTLFSSFHFGPTITTADGAILVRPERQS
jgi:hypothetical protein